MNHLDLGHPLTDYHFVALDFETTGLSAARDRVIEIGAFRFQLVHSSSSELNQLINPQMPIPALVTGIHGIQDQDVADQPVFKSFAAELMTFLSEAVLLAHHAAFDMAFLTCELRRAGIEPPPLTVLDSYHFARQVFSDAPSYKLSALLEYLEIAMPGQAHRALPDAIACSHLFKACLNKLPDASHLTLTELLEKHPRIRVGVQDLNPAEFPAQSSLQEAIEAQEDVLIAYRNARNELLERRITPILLGGYGRYSYVEAFCHLREANRQFRIDRIQSVRNWQPVA